MGTAWLLRGRNTWLIVIEKLFKKLGKTIKRLILINFRRLIFRSLTSLFGPLILTKTFKFVAGASSWTAVIWVALVPYLHVGVYHLIQRVIRLEWLIGTLHTTHCHLDHLAHWETGLYRRPFLVIHWKFFWRNTISGIVPCFIVFMIFGIKPKGPLSFPPVLDSFGFVVLIGP